LLKKKEQFEDTNKKYTVNVGNIRSRK